MAETEPNAAAAAPEPEAPQPAAIVYKKKKKKKRKKYSRGLRDIQRAERRVSKAADRLTRAARKGTRTYRKRRNKSARKRRDGAVTDVFINLSEGAADAFASGAPVITDLTRAVQPRRLRREARRQFRAFARLVSFPFFR